MNRAFADVYECFSWEGMECLAVERVDLPDVASWITAASDSEQQSRIDMACEGVASALDWLLTPPRSARRTDWSAPRGILLREVATHVREVAVLIIHSSAIVVHRFATPARLHCRYI